MNTCPICNRRINQMSGRSQLRKHNSSKGVVCAGSWKSPDRIRFELGLKEKSIGELTAIIQLGKEYERIDVTNEIRRRLKHGKSAIQKKLDEVQADERLSYPTATIAENAPLALEQLTLETWRSALRWVLKLMEESNG